jgi:hypothetical protein
MSTPQKRQINHVVFNPNGTYVYSRPGSNTTFRTPSGHVAAAALERAMLTAGIVRARREAEIKREELLKAEANLASVEASLLPDPAAIENEAPETPQTPETKGFFGNLFDSIKRLVARLRRAPSAPTPTAPAAPDQFLARAARRAPTESKQPQHADVGQELSQAIEPQSPATKNPEPVAVTAAAPAPAAPAVSAAVAPSEAAAPSSPSNGTPADSKSEPKNALEGIQETEHGYHLTFQDGFTVDVPFNSPEAAVFANALDKIETLNEQYDHLMGQLAPQAPAKQQQPSQEIEGKLVRAPDSPNGTPRYALEMADGRWQALNLSPEGLALLGSLHAKGALGQGVVTMDAQWQVALSRLEVAGKMVTPDQIAKPDATKQAPPASTGPASSSPSLPPFPAWEADLDSPAARDAVANALKEGVPLTAVTPSSGPGKAPGNSSLGAPVRPDDLLKIASEMVSSRDEWLENDVRDGNVSEKEADRVRALNSRHSNAIDYLLATNRSDAAANELKDFLVRVSTGDKQPSFENRVEILEAIAADRAKQESAAIAHLAQEIKNTPARQAPSPADSEKPAATSPTVSAAAEKQEPKPEERPQSKVPVLIRVENTPELTEQTQSPESPDTAELEEGSLIADKASGKVRIGVQKGLFDVIASGPAMEKLLSLAAADVVSAIVAHNADGSVAIKEFVNAHDNSHQPAVSLIGEEPSGTFADSPADQQGWRETIESLNSARAEMATVSAGSPTEGAAATAAPEPAADPDSEYRRAREGQSMDIDVSI